MRRLRPEGGSYPPLTLEVESMETITGKIESLSKSFNGWRFATASFGPIVGHIPEELQPGDTCIFEGEWSTHPKYGKQFKVKQAVIEIPRDEAGIREYLARSFMWIGPTLAERLVEKFGDKLFEVIEHGSEKLSQISGITVDRAREIHEEYLRIKEDRTDDLWFAKNHITLNMRNRLLQTYGNKKKVISTVEANPYVLADEIFGVGFKKADAIALSIGTARDSAVRVGACLRWILKEANSEGHCYLPQSELIGRCIEFLSCDYGQVFAAISDSLNSGKVTQIGEHVYNTFLYGAEIAIAKKLRALAAAPHAQIMHNLSKIEIVELDEDQYAALELALKSKIVIITGGPGTGKTHTIRKIIEALGDRKIELACPTGKASKRLSEMTEREARTIHRLLEYNPAFWGFSRNADNPLECDTLIIDETSMIDVLLMHSLMAALTLDTQVIFVGDHHQLPSVGAGRVLSDMIESGIVPVAYLKTLHRQAAKSRINLNAKKINAGEKLVAADFSAPTDPKGDFWFVSEDSADLIPDLIVKIIQAIPEKFGHSLDDIQVLCPQKRGPIGTEKMNEILRPVLNAAGQKLHGVTFQFGDRVIQMKNNYELGIFNGDIGIVDSVDKNYLYIDFEDLKGKREVLYPISDVGELQLAYALTVHKFQGSENPVIIMPVHTSNYMMLKRGIIYTGITRGKKLVVLVGTMKAVNLAIRTLDMSERYSNLKRWLVDSPPGKEADIME